MSAHSHDGAERPTGSVIVPFRGAASELGRVIERLGRLERNPGDELIVADNRPGARRGTMGSGVRVVAAAGLRTPAHARNAAAAEATGEWLVFIDSDTDPDPRLLACYLDPAPAPEVGILGGVIKDVAATDTPTARYLSARGQMSQQVTLGRRGRPYVQTANCAVRREAFRATGGFVACARAGEDADLCFRLAAAGWRLESRPATVRHLTRAGLPAALRQMIVHGAGAAWLERRYPGEFPRPGASELARRAGHYLRQALAAAHAGDGEAARAAAIELACLYAFDLGRLLPNHVR